MTDDRYRDRYCWWDGKPAPCPDHPIGGTASDAPDMQNAKESMESPTWADLERTDRGYR
jgi:hypothetical protein